MLIKNGMVFTDEGRFVLGDLVYENGKIVEIAQKGSITTKKAIDAEGGYVLPGFIDIHTHGAMGADFCDGEASGIEKMLAYYGKQGVTSVVPATMSFNEPILADILKTALPYFEKEGYGSVLRGVNMEGPFLNIKKKGAQNGKFIVEPSLEMFNHLYELSGGHICLVDIAPELQGSLEFIREIKNKCAISIAHTNANYDEAFAAFEAGASHVTHMFNAMPPFGHRDPGVIGAASDKARFVEIITDGIHLHPSVARAVFKWFGEKRVCLVSDSMRACGMPNGNYSLGGQKVLMENGKATLEDGTIAGSATNLADCCRYAVKFGVPIEQAVRACTINPAKAVGLDNEIGSFAKGKRADIMIWDRNLQTRSIIIGGNTNPIQIHSKS